MASQYSIFKPKSTRGLFVDYPELRTHEEFSKLTNDEMLFVWYYACEASPLYKISNDRKRVEEAIDNSFLKNGKKKISDREANDYKAGKFPAKISAAIKKMVAFKVGPRVRAKMLIEQSMNHIEEILNVDLSDKTQFLNKDGEVDWSKKKAFVDTIAKSNEIFPTLVKQLEGGFAISEEKKGGSAMLDGESLMDDYHEKDN